MHPVSILGAPGSIFSRFLYFFLFFGSVVFVGLLGCWVVGLVGCWVVGLLGWWNGGLLNWIVGSLLCWFVESRIHVQKTSPDHKVPEVI